MKKSKPTARQRTASKIKVQKLPKPASAETEEQCNLRHGEDFRDLETPMRELFCMSEITRDVTAQPHEDQEELICFAVYRLCDMISDLRAKYRTDLHAGPDRGTSS